MAFDPKKNDELRDEDLAKLSGGAGDGGSSDERPADEDGPLNPSTPTTPDKRKLGEV